MKDLEELKRQRLNIRAISRLTGLDRKTIRRYLLVPEVPVYGPRAAQPSKLDGFKAYLKERMQAGVWSARVLLGEAAATGLWRRRWTRSWARCGGCTKKPPASQAGCWRRFSAAVGQSVTVSVRR